MRFVRLRFLVGISALIVGAASFFRSARANAQSGGSATLSKQGETKFVGPVKCGETATFAVNGPSTVRFELWFVLGKAPCGVWTVSGSKQQFVGCTGGGTCSTGEQGEIRATGLSGSFPVGVSFSVP